MANRVQSIVLSYLKKTSGNFKLTHYRSRAFTTGATIARGIFSAVCHPGLPVLPARCAIKNRNDMSQKVVWFSVAALVCAGFVKGGGQSAACADCLFASDQEILRALLGFEQVGASGSPSGHDFLFDLFISRAAVSPRIRWWGDVKVASFPQQVNSQIVQFSQEFSSSFGGLTVNQLAESAEFVTGPELVISQHAHSALTLFAGGGAIGPNNPSDAATVFEIPATKSPQYAALTNQVGAIPSGSTYIAFLPESDGRFSREWQAGVRLYTSYGAGSSPGTVEFSVGQNEFVTNAHLSGMVGHVAATHPFTIKGVTVYLFGEATTAYKRSQFTTPLLLEPALENSNPVPVTNPGVYAVTVPANQRDTYRIGVALDLVSVIRSWFP